MKKAERANPEILFKAMKNPAEIENIRKAEIKDSVAHVRFMKWLKENIGKIKITEMSASDKLDEFRKEMGNFIRPSFEPISSFGSIAPCAIIPHPLRRTWNSVREAYSLRIRGQDSMKVLRILPEPMR